VYAYDPQNRRVYASVSGSDTIFLYDEAGEKLGGYSLSYVSANNTLSLTAQFVNVYFAGRLISKGGSGSGVGGGIALDRLGSVGSAYYPFGVEYSATANDTEKYATYTRDSVTGLDYAMNRYYSSIWGCFLSPDPYRANNGGPGDPADPQSWNRYAYVEGDPVNSNDSSGLMMCIDCPNGEGDPATGDPLEFEFFLGFWFGGGAPGNPGGGGGGGTPWYQKHPCDKADPTNAKIMNFIAAHKTDAQALAAQVNVPWELILDVAAVETNYGTRIVGFANNVATNNYFGLHVNSATADSQYANQTGVYTTGTATTPVYIAEFSAQSGFLDSGTAFLSAESAYITNLNNVTTFAQDIHAHGYGLGQPTYVSTFQSANGNISARENCPN
jgi:RHS repeat-associated protein